MGWWSDLQKIPAIEATLRDHIENHPGGAAEIPPALLDRLDDIDAELASDDIAQREQIEIDAAQLDKLRTLAENDASIHERLAVLEDEPPTPDPDPEPEPDPDPPTPDPPTDEPVLQPLPSTPTVPVTGRVYEVNMSRSLISELVAASSGGYDVALIPAGTHYLPVESDRSHSEVLDLRDLRIVGYGATLILTDPSKGGLWLMRCTNCSLEGVTITREKVPFTDGVVEATGSNWFDFRVHDGYPLLSNVRPRGYVFDSATRLFKEQSNEISGIPATKTGDRTYRFESADLAWAMSQGKIETGDLMSFDNPSHHDIMLWGCTDMTLRDVELSNCGGFAIGDEFGGGNSLYDNVRLTYGEPPTGGTERPLRSAQADGFHFRDMDKGPTIKNCWLEACGDDALPIHGTFGRVSAASTGNTIKVSSDYNAFRNATEIHILNANAEPVARAGVGSTILNGGEWTLFLDKSVSVQSGWYVSNPDRNGSGFLIDNCVIKNNRARGIMLRAGEGQIANNWIEGSTYCAIALNPAAGMWGEAGYSDNVVIRGNHIKRCGIAHMGSWLWQAGAGVSVTATQRTTPGGHVGIVIEDNVIEDCDGVQILVNAAKDVTLKNNEFVNAQQSPTIRGSDLYDTTQLVVVENSENVTQ